MVESGAARNENDTMPLLMIVDVSQCNHPLKSPDPRTHSVLQKVIQIYLKEVCVES
jgi:hypothetical protein